MVKSISTIVGAALAILSAVASPVRSSVGSDGIGGEADETWGNPYVTDGLVCMYDGEWNVAPGRHDPNASFWVDLMRPQVSIPLTCGTWESACLMFENEPCIIARDAGVAFSSASAFTVQAVCSIEQTEDAPTSPCSAVSVGYAAIRPFFLPSGVPLRVDMFWGDVLQWYNIDSIPCASVQTFVKEEAEEDKSWYFVYSGGNLKGSRNTGNKSLGGEIRLNGYEKSHPFRTGLVLRVYTLRIYNRALTGEEIAFNAAVDSERFNLP